MVLIFKDRGDTTISHAESNFSNELVIYAQYERNDMELLHVGTFFRVRGA